MTILTEIYEIEDKEEYSVIYENLIIRKSKSLIYIISSKKEKK